MEDKNYAHIDRMIKELGYKNEDEMLNDLLSDDFMKIPCCACGKKRNVDDLIFEDGEPYCKNGCE